MFIGHYAAAFAAKKTAPKVSLGTLFFAATAMDLLWSVLMAAGVEHARIVPGFTKMTPLDLYDFPYSHSLAGALTLSGVIAGVFYALVRDRNSSLVVGAAVFSHWVLDFLSHAPDLPLAPAVNVMLGLGLWNHPAASIAVEGGFFIAGLALYVRSAPAKGWAGRLAFWPLPALLAFAWLGNMKNVPPAMTAVIVSSLVGTALTIPWGAWADTLRNSGRTAAAPVSTAREVGA